MSVTHPPFITVGTKVDAYRKEWYFLSFTTGSQWDTCRLYVLAAENNSTFLWLRFHYDENDEVCSTMLTQNTALIYDLLTCCRVAGELIELQERSSLST